MTFVDDGSWFVNVKPSKNPKLRLLCFHHTGGSASFYYKWRNMFPPEVEVIAAQLPGREERSKEPLITDPVLLISEITKQLTSYNMFNMLPTIFFGHSFGSILAFEVYKQLLSLTDFQLKCLIVSGHGGPPISYNWPKIAGMTDNQLITWINQEYGQIDPEILTHDELMQLLLPRLRADFLLCENYRYEGHAILQCPIIVFGGVNDDSVSYQQLWQWQKQTSQAVDVHMLSGGHFFLDSNRSDFISLLIPIIAKFI